MTTIDRLAMKGKRIPMPADLQQQALDHILCNHMGVRKRKLLAKESIYWINMNTEIENTVK